MDTTRRRDLLNSVRQSDEETRLQMVMELDSSPATLAYPILQEIANTDSSARVRYTARRALERLRQNSGSGEVLVQDPLVAELDAKEPADRSKAVVALAGTGNSDYLGAIIDRLALESEVKVIASLLLAVGRLGSSRELSLLAGYTDHDNPRVRANVIEALYALNTPVALPLVMPFLTDSDNRVRANAAIALRRVGKDRAIKVLKKMVVSPHLWMRASAAYALGLFDPAVAMPLLEICQKDPSSKVRARAERALNRIARHQARKSAKHSMKHGTPLSGPQVQPPAPEAPVATPDEAVMTEWSGPMPTGEIVAEPPPEAPVEVQVSTAAPPVEVAAEGSGMRDVDDVITRQDRKRLARLVADLEREEDRFVTARVLSAIGILEEQGFTDTLVHHLRHPDPRVAANAVWALTRLGDVSCREDVRPLLRSMQPRLRANAILYFATDPTVDVFVPLSEMLASKDIQTRMSGLFCLAEMRRPDLLTLVEDIVWDPDDLDVRSLLRERLLELERRGMPQARSVHERLIASRTRPAERGPLTATPPRPEGEGLATGGPPELSLPRWQAYFVVCRVLATLTDVAVATVPILLGLVALSRLTGGLPPSVPSVAALVGLALFLCRDIPNGPGVGKRLLGLSVKPQTEGNPLRYLIRQAPVLLVPWGLLELWGATKDPKGQRATDARLKLMVAPSGEPQMGLFFCLWLVLGALVTAVYGALTLHGPTTDPLWSEVPREVSPDTRSSASVSPIAFASASPRPEEVGGPTALAPPGAHSAESPTTHFNHVSIGLSVPIPKGWQLAVSGSTFVELRPSKGSEVTTGALTLFVPAESDEAGTPAEWNAALAQRVKHALRDHGTPLIFWCTQSNRAQVGSRTGVLYRGDTQAQGSVLVFSRDDGQLGVMCRAKSADPNVSTALLLDGFVKHLKLLSVARDWRRYTSPFHHLSLAVPSRWQVERDTHHDIVLRSTHESEPGWIRLDPDQTLAGNRPGWAQVRARATALRQSTISNQRFEKVQETSVTVPHHPEAKGVAWNLRNPDGDTAWLAVAWLTAPASFWAEQWMDSSSGGNAHDLQDLLASLQKHDI